LLNLIPPENTVTIWPHPIIAKQNEEAAGLPRFFAATAMVAALLVIVGKRETPHHAQRQGATNRVK
jgi:hypothetical protein